MSERRDIEFGSDTNGPVGASGRNVIAVIGIDCYHHWRRLSNAVRDANGAAALFQRLGFTQVTEPLLNDRATGRAMQSLVTDDLRPLGADDSLVLFYAGHGTTQKYRLGDRALKTGYLVPVDAQDKIATWIDLEGWLRAISLLPAKHILVVLDACHSGIALDPIIKWREDGTRQDAPLATLRARRSRKIITSALDDQVALDCGPVHGHSLFTGCLIEGLTDGLLRGSAQVITGSELALYVQRRVETYPHSRQTPDFGTFAFDERGEMVIPLVIDGPDDHSTIASPAPPPSAMPEHMSTAPTPEPPTGYLRDRSWRRVVVVGAAGLAFAITLIGLSRDGAPVDTVRGVAAQGPPNAAAVEARPSVAVDTPPDASTLPAPSTKPNLGDCPRGMVPVPAGTFRMGSPKGVGYDDEYPDHLVTLSAYCIDKTEVTVKAYAACVAAGDCAAAPLTVNGRPYSGDDVRYWSRLCNGDDRPDHPINCVDWTQATTYCKWASRRLPTEAEWEYAARGTDGRAYPWGYEAPGDTRLNTCDTQCAIAKLNRKRSQAEGEIYDDRLEMTAPVGSFPDGASAFGALDMAGNVWEWTADWYGLYPTEPATNPRGANTGTARVYRGGNWGSKGASNVRTATRNDAQPSFRDPVVGFRCARNMVDNTPGQYCPPGTVPVPSGTFRMGNDGLGAVVHEVTLSAYCMDRTEVTVKAYAACVAAKACTAATHTEKRSTHSTEELEEMKLYSRSCNRDDRPDHPINCVDWRQARAYCKWADARLPTEAEWEYAARGTDGRRYPWGNAEPSATRLNACGTEYLPKNKRAPPGSHWAAMYNASDGWETTAPVGSFPDGASPFGALDMAGNVWEWTEDWYSAYSQAPATNPRGANTGAARVVRGGGWGDSYASGIRADNRSGDDPTERRSIIGFRCARASRD